MLAQSSFHRADQRFLNGFELGLQGGIHHPDLRGSGLEAQMVGWVPGAPKSVQTVSSPDRVDALVWLVREMLYPEAKTPKQSSRTKSKMSSWT